MTPSSCIQLGGWRKFQSQWKSRRKHCCLDLCPFRGKKLERQLLVSFPLETSRHVFRTSYLLPSGERKHLQRGWKQVEVQALWFVWGKDMQRDKEHLAQVGINNGLWCLLQHLACSDAQQIFGGMNKWRLCQ